MASCRSRALRAHRGAAERRLTPRGEASVAFLPIVLAVVIYGPAGAIYVGVASLFLEFKEPYARWFLWTSSRSVAAGCAGLVALHVAGDGELSFGRLTATVAAATVAQQGTDFLLGAVLARLRGSSFQEIGRIASAAFVTVPLYMPMTALLVYAYRELSPWSVALFLFPAFAAQKLFLLYREQRATAEELARAVLRQEQAHLSFASALVATLDARDRYTAGHSASVAAYARDIANRLGLTEDRQRLAHLCGLVHDVGKIGLPPGLLEKAGPLTLEERRQMEEHSAIGERILARVDDYAEIAEIVRHHHERVDGGGYPDRLANMTSLDLQNPCGCRRLRRDDLRPTVPRRDATSGRTNAHGTSRRDAVRHGCCRCLRGDPCPSERGLPDRGWP